MTLASRARLAALIALTSASAAVAQTPRVPQGRTLAATCAACHGTDGAAVAGEPMAALAGYPKTALIAQMKAFRAGAREATVMHQIARGYSDDEIDAIATWLASRPVPQPVRQTGGAR